MCLSCRSRQELSNEYFVFTCKNWRRYSRERALKNIKFHSHPGNLISYPYHTGACVPETAEPLPELLRTTKSRPLSGGSRPAAQYRGLFVPSPTHIRRHIHLGLSTKRVQKKRKKENIYRPKIVR